MKARALGPMLAGQPLAGTDRGHLLIVTPADRPDAGASDIFLAPIRHRSNTLAMEPGGYRCGD